MILVTEFIKKVRSLPQVIVQQNEDALYFRNQKLDTDYLKGVNGNV